MKKSLFLFLCALCVFFSSCVKAGHKSLLDQVKAKGELVVALEGAWEPWNYHDEQGRLVGFDVDVAKEMCKRMGVRAKFVEFEWERLFSCLENGECDIWARADKFMQQQYHKIGDGKKPSQKVYDQYNEIINSGN